MSSVVISGDTSGAITLAAPAVSGTNTATLPAATGTVMVSGNMPAFSAYLNSNQSITASTFTKVQCNIEEFDTANAYDKATNYRFTPQVAGYYQINGEVSATGTTITRLITMIYKNGALYKLGYDTSAGAGKGGVSSIVYFNGSTDYVELYTLMSGTGLFAAGSSGDPSPTYFNGCMIRAA